jgi:hypothetical protein
MNNFEYTNNLKFPLLLPNQSGKEITHNEALIIIDNLLQNCVLDILSVPPPNPNTNDMYIITDNASDEWTNRENYLAFYDNGWRFVEARVGFTFWVVSESCFYTYFSTGWDKTLKNMKLQDLGNVLFSEISANDILIYNGNNFVNSSDIAINNVNIRHNNIIKTQLKINTEGKLSVNVSDDGQNWNESFTIDNTTGNILFNRDVKIKDNWLDDLLGGSTTHGFKWIQDIYIQPNTTEIIINLDNTKTYKIFFENLKSVADVNNNDLVMIFGDINDNFIAAGYKYRNDLLYADNSTTTHYSYSLNSPYMVLTWEKYDTSGVYNTTGMFGEITIKSSDNVCIQVYGNTETMIPEQMMGCFLRSYNFLPQALNYTQLKLFTTISPFESGVVKVFQIL